MKHDPKHVMDATSAFYDSCVKFEAGRPGWPGTVHMEAAMNRLMELGWRTPEQHDASLHPELATGEDLDRLAEFIKLGVKRNLGPPDHRVLTDDEIRGLIINKLSIIK